METCYPALTLNNVLSDPMVRSAMAADRVDPQQLAAMLASVAETLAPARPAMLSRTPSG